MRREAEGPIVENAENFSFCATFSTLSVFIIAVFITDQNKRKLKGGVVLLANPRDNPESPFRGPIFLPSQSETLQWIMYFIVLRWLKLVRTVARRTKWWNEKSPQPCDIQTRAETDCEWNLIHHFFSMWLYITKMVLRYPQLADRNSLPVHSTPWQGSSAALLLTRCLVFLT